MKKAIMFVVAMVALLVGVLVFGPYKLWSPSKPSTPVVEREPPASSESPHWGPDWEFAEMQRHREEWAAWSLKWDSDPSNIFFKDKACSSVSEALGRSIAIMYDETGDYTVQQKRTADLLNLMADTFYEKRC
ncbi:hypothetical protein N9S00_08130 [Luminiphilus sp.]|nr:hypothetical protein [Luminiphilus sp.]